MGGWTEDELNKLRERCGVIPPDVPRDFAFEFCGYRIGFSGSDGGYASAMVMASDKESVFYVLGEVTGDAARVLAGLAVEVQRLRANDDR